MIGGLEPLAQQQQLEALDAETVAGLERSLEGLGQLQRGRCWLLHIARLRAASRNLGWWRAPHHTTTANHTS